MAMQKTQPSLRPRQNNPFSRIFFQYMPYWPLFAILLAVAGVGAWTYLHFANPVYEATARVLIKDENKGIADSKTIESLNQLSPKKIIENEIEVIQSRTLLNNVVTNMGLYANVYRDRTFGSQDLYLESPVRITARFPDSLEGSRKVPFTLSPQAGTIKFEGQVYPLDQWANTVYGQLKFTATGKPAKGDEYIVISSTRSATEQLQQSLKVTSVSKLSSILALNLTDRIPRRSEEVLNALLDEYSRAVVSDKNKLAKNTLDFVEERLKGVQTELDSIERRIKNYKSSTGAIDVSTQGRLILENVSTNDQRVGEMNVQMAVLNQVQSYVNGRSRGAGIVPSTLGVTDPTLSQLVNKLYNLELEYEGLKKTTGENNSMLVSLKDQIDRIRPSILENIENQRQGLLASLDNVAATNRQYSTALQSFPEQEKELIDINRQQSIKNGIYTFLLQKKEETALSYASTVPDSRTIDKAQSTGKPISPKKKLIYLAAFIATLLLGIGFVMARDSLSQKIVFRSQIEELTALPIIGEVATEESRDPIVIQENKKTFIAEQFRKLRSSLGYIGVSSKRKRILVTSSVSGEGKSFIATNLAISLALSGKKVALLDFDLNNPSINNKLNTSNSVGITDFLLGEAKLEDIINETDVHPNLFLIPTGELPGNPSELTMRPEVNDLLDQLDEKFDYIVIDTAPVGPVTDAYMLAPACDAVLYVVRHKYTPKIFIERLDEEIKIHQLPNAAIVFNAVQPRGFASKYYGQGYGYGYISKVESKTLPRLKR